VPEEQEIMTKIRKLVKTTVEADDKRDRKIAHNQAVGNRGRTVIAVRMQDNRETRNIHSRRKKITSIGSTGTKG
jgi:hypothetical protein